MGLDVSQIEQRVTVQVTEQVAEVLPAPDARVEVTAAEQRIDVHVDEQVVVVSERGTPGAPGASGIVTAIAGETIHAQRAVRVADGVLYHPDTSNTAHAPSVIGIALQSVATGEACTVRTAGTVTEPSWSWSPGFVFCGDDGQLTQAPGSGWLLVIGRAINPTTLDVDVDDPIIRS